MSLSASVVFECLTEVRASSRALRLSTSRFLLSAILSSLVLSLSARLAFKNSNKGVDVTLGVTEPAAGDECQTLKVPQVKFGGQITRFHGRMLTCRCFKEMLFICFRSRFPLSLFCFQSFQEFQIVWVISNCSYSRIFLSRRSLFWYSLEWSILHYSRILNACQTKKKL